MEKEDSLRNWYGHHQVRQLAPDDLLHGFTPLTENTHERLAAFFVVDFLIHPQLQQEGELAILTPLHVRRDDWGFLCGQGLDPRPPEPIVDLLPLSGTGGG